MYVRHRQKILIGVTLLVIACLLVSGTVVYYEYFATKKVTPIEKPIVALDDRISPLENQGVVLEVLRIRHRGLLDKLITRGNSWKNTPTFYFVTNMDGLEYASKDVTQHGRTAEILFNTWDTFGQENKIMKDCDEEQETSTVTLTIVEQVKTASSAWIKTLDPWYADFAWQTGYGEFSVSPIHVEAVREYIRNQAEHHRQEDF